MSKVIVIPRDVPGKAPLFLYRYIYTDLHISTPPPLSIWLRLHLESGRVVLPRFTISTPTLGTITCTIIDWTPRPKQNNTSGLILLHPTDLFRHLTRTPQDESKEAPVPAYPANTRVAPLRPFVGCRIGGKRLKAGGLCRSVRWVGGLVGSGMDWDWGSLKSEEE